jgi:hypothetical protein
MPPRHRTSHWHNILPTVIANSRVGVGTPLMLPDWLEAADKRAWNNFSGTVNELLNKLGYKLHYDRTGMPPRCANCWAIPLTPSTNGTTHQSEPDRIPSLKEHAVDEPEHQLA